MRNEGSQKEVTKAEFITLKKRSCGYEVFTLNFAKFCTARNTTLYIIGWLLQIAVVLRFILIFLVFCGLDGEIQ